SPSAKTAASLQRKPSRLPRGRCWTKPRCEPCASAGAFAAGRSAPTKLPLALTSRNEFQNLQLMNPFFANIVVDLFLKGGPVMWPILACMIAAVVVGLERALWWWNLKRRSQPSALNETFDAVGNGEFARAIQLTEQSNDPHLLTVREG